MTALDGGRTCGAAAPAGISDAAIPHPPSTPPSTHVAAGIGDVETDMFFEDPQLLPPTSRPELQPVPAPKDKFPPADGGIRNYGPHG